MTGLADVDGFKIGKKVPGLPTPETENYVKLPKHGELPLTRRQSVASPNYHMPQRLNGEFHSPIQKWSLIISDGSRISQMGEANPKGGGANLLFWKFSPKTA